MIYRVDELRNDITGKEHDSSMIIFSLVDNEDNAEIQHVSYSYMIK